MFVVWYAPKHTVWNQFLSPTHGDSTLRMLGKKLRNFEKKGASWNSGTHRDPCVVYTPTFGWYLSNVGKYIIHGSYIWGMIWIYLPTQNAIVTTFLGSGIRVNLQTFICHWNPGWGDRSKVWSTWWPCHDERLRLWCAQSALPMLSIGIWWWKTMINQPWKLFTVHSKHADVYS